MLDTGIDVPEVVNLVFFKLVRSRTKFWQMIGRGTRLCPDLFEPGKDKQFFYLFDYCQNLEFFSQNPETTDGSLGDSLGTRLFKSRLELLSELDRKLESGIDCEAGAETSAIYGEPKTEAEVRFSIAETLHSEIASMNLDNFVVRPRRRLVEKYSKPEAWIKLSSEDFSELSHGYDRIELFSERILVEQKQTIRKVCYKLIGPEITEESSNCVVIQDLLNPNELPIKKGVQRMFLIAVSMGTKSLSQTLASFLTMH